MTAIISPCETYRYWLERQWTDADLPPDVEPSAGPAVFVMCNPSTADATNDDATIRKCRGFAQQYGRTKLIVVNAFAHRSRYPSDLLKSATPSGRTTTATLAMLSASPTRSSSLLGVTLFRRSCAADCLLSSTYCVPAGRC